MDTKVVSSLFFCIFAFCLVAGDVCPKFDPGIGQGYIPGTPGASWTTEEILIVKEKVMAMIHPDNTDLNDDRTRFPPNVNRVYGSMVMGTSGTRTPIMWQIQVEFSTIANFQGQTMTSALLAESWSDLPFTTA